MPNEATRESVVRQPCTSCQSLISTDACKLAVVLNLKDDSSDAYTTLTSATVSFTLAATPAVEQGQKTVKEAFVSKIDSRERWSNLVAPLQQVIKVCAGIAEVCYVCFIMLLRAIHISSYIG